jgi:nicotinate-nucleotide adenylyltransferase
VVVVAVYGGSFNPPHVGHALVASWALWTGAADRVVLLPTYRHAFDKALAPWDERLRLCEALACALGASVSVSRIEADLPVPSYTIDSLDALRAETGARLRLLIGADVLPTVSAWKRWDRIEQEYAPIVVGRAGYANPADSVVFPDVSSTEVRERLRAGRSVAHLVPADVRSALGPYWSAA